MRKHKQIFVYAILSMLLAACHQSPNPSQTDRQAVADAVKKETAIEEKATSQKSVSVTTKHYSLALPDDWVVLYGPVNERGTTRFQLADKAKTSTISITVGPSRAGDAEQIAKLTAKRLQTNAVQRNGQWQYVFKNDRGAGYTIVREDNGNALLMVITVSGDISKAEFIYRMRSPYTALLPQKI